MMPEFEIPEDLWREIATEIGDAADAEGLEFVDNLRACRVRDGLNQEHYEFKKTAGCCGVYDWELTDKRGDVWKVGCNYGH